MVLESEIPFPNVGENDFFKLKKKAETSFYEDILFINLK